MPEMGSSQADRSTIRASQGQPMWVLVNHVKANRREAFERFVHDILRPMAEQTSMDQFRQTRFLHPTATNEDGTYTYVFLMDPLVVGADYTFEGFKQFYGEEKAREYEQIWEEAFARPQEAYELIQSSW